MNASILVLYSMCVVSIVVGFYLWRFTKKVTIIEWLVTSVVGLIFTGILHLCAINSMTDDTETWSGQIIQAKQYSAWKEYYEVAVYRTETRWRTETYTYTTGSGKNARTRTGTRRVSYTVQVFDHWSPRTKWHDESFDSMSNIGTSYGISKDKFNYFVDKFKNKTAVMGDRSTMSHASKMIEGDPNDYLVTPEITRWIEPVTKLVSFENKIKASPSVFSFVKVSDKIKVFDYPTNSNHFVSDRLLGNCKGVIPDIEWDQMNARLGPVKKVNVILVGFDSTDSMMGQYQESKWIGGKKNDVVITYGGSPTSPAWCYVFGWTESNTAKHNLESIILNQGVTKSIIPSIEQEITKNYVIKDWKKFDYLTVEIPVNKMMWVIAIQFVIFSILHFVSFKVDIVPENQQSAYPPSFNRW